MTIKTYTTFGVQRSGTNFCEKLLHYNFKNISPSITDAEYVWKHTPDTSQVIQKYHQLNKQHHLHLVITKNPYKWIESIKRNPVDIAVTIRGMKETNHLEKNQILKCNIEKQKNENWYVEELSIPSLIFYYNYFYNNWLEMKNQIKHWGVVRYEALLSTTKAGEFLDNLSHAFDLLPKVQGKWTYPTRVPMSDSWEVKSFANLKIDDYSDLTHVRTLTQDQIDTIYNHLDMPLLEKLGYPTEKPISRTVDIG